MSKLIDVVVLITPDGRWGARALEPDEHQSEVVELMMCAWRDSLRVSDYHELMLENANPTAVLQKMTTEGYHKIGAQYGHWINTI